MPSEPRTPVKEAMVLAFENAEHRRYFELVLEFGFLFAVDRQLRVSTSFVHPAKGMVVQLWAADPRDALLNGKLDGDYDPVVRILKRNAVPLGDWFPVGRVDDYDTPLAQDGDYTAIESEWIMQAGDDGLEFLRRELHIWLKVRPNTMNALLGGPA